MKILYWINDVLLVLSVLIIAILLLGLPTMILWNWLMPAIFGLSKITFFQACGLQVLFTLLLGNFGKITTKEK